MLRSHETAGLFLHPAIEVTLYEHVANPAALHYFRDGESQCFSGSHSQRVAEDPDQLVLKSL
jgi:hypothetical protein